MSSDGFEIVESGDIFKQMVEKPDLSAIKNWLSPTDYLASSSEFKRHAFSKALQIIETNRSSRALLRDWMSQLLPHSEVLQLYLWEHVKDEKTLDSSPQNNCGKNF
ncbi:hypothetical protein NHQ30_009922 [Ciborinia camelliae]|nr:hypothetical protein NHQ30_009922 [Ciborinia camelliae]